MGPLNKDPALEYMLLQAVRFAFRMHQVTHCSSNSQKGITYPTDQNIRSATIVCGHHYHIQIYFTPLNFQFHQLFNIFIFPLMLVYKQLSFCKIYIQQQQHSLFSQASWGRLKMKPKRNKGHGSGTLIASLQALLSKAISLEIFQSLRSLLTDSSQVSLVLPLPLFTLSTRSKTPLRTDASGGLRWTCPNHLSRC